MEKSKNVKKKFGYVFIGTKTIVFMETKTKKMKKITHKT